MGPTIKNENPKNWTDDLAICRNSGIGFSTNQIYREDGAPQENHPYEDLSCHHQFENCFLYAIYDGHEGRKANEFCYQQMTAEIFLSGLGEKNSEENIREILRQAFISVEKEYLESLGALIAEQTSLMEDIKGLSIYEAHQKYPQVAEKIESINAQLSSGTAAAVCLIFNNKLYVANVGNCRVLLCQTDANDVMKVVQLSVDHDLRNEDELLRLLQIGIDVNALKYGKRLGNQENTRCLGNYLVKGGYKEFEELGSAVQEPIIAEPDIHGGITLDESCKFLLLMSAGLYKSIEEATKTDQVNKYIAQCIVEQFREQSTLPGVAQAVVDKAVRLHHDWYMSNSMNTTKREDITLILRNFNFPLHADVKSPTVAFNSIISNIPCSSQQTLTNSIASSINNVATNSSTSSCEIQNSVDLGIGPDKKITSYVNFDDFYKNLDIIKQNTKLPDWLFES